VMPIQSDREKRIAEAAYYRAEKRGFAPGYALEDWLAAEALVEFELAAEDRRIDPEPASTA
jgi:Protein of unknown function (DUF2934)